jgi:uncharacterized protein (DUF2147 family)
MGKKLRYIIVAACICTGFSLAAQSATGTWKTVDDRDDGTKAIINIYEEDGHLYGYVQEILEKGKENALCTACDGPLKNKHVLGMRILDSLWKNRHGQWEGGKKSLLDPEQGRYFRAKVWLDPADPDKLKVRGYLLFLFRTQTWLRVTESRQ